MAAILFDLDGTILNSEALIVASFRHAARAVLRLDLSEPEALARWGEPLPVRFTSVTRSPDTVAALLEAYATFYDAHLTQLADVFPGIPEMLGTLRLRRHVLGIVTSKRGRATATSLQAFELAPFFGAAVSADEVEAPKPAPDPVIEALWRLAASRDDALMVGDGVFDIQAAQAAGIPAAAALWGTREQTALLACRPDYVVRSPAEVVTLVGAK
jgi:pyrophosphatase PpaX